MHITVCSTKTQALCASSSFRYKYLCTTEIYTVRNEKTRFDSPGSYYQPCSFSLVISTKTMINTDSYTLYTKLFLYVLVIVSSLHGYVHNGHSQHNEYCR
ncbi:hypothetical protein PVAP13_9KG446385 [Panicum virgatum]|uniref:Uncharacterized protein n=1 Tax=Panicum virgatum TaxID=38727 RepID=A0A8T0NU72_PANVG|nr:hypothetical protein PVAP13_9KG446385 [Panicum virgatum]